MKKILGLLLSLAMIFSALATVPFTVSAGIIDGTDPNDPYEANDDFNDTLAQNVIDMITALGTVTSLDSKDAVVAARAAYDVLSAEQKLLVTNYADLQTAETAIADLEAAADVIAQITDLGTITWPESKDAVEAARAAYDALTPAQQALVTNYTTLQQDEATLASGKAVADVIQLINDLGAITNLDQKDMVVSTRTAYNGLTAEQQVLITNYSALTAAEEKIAELEEIANVMKGDVDDNGTVTVSDVVELRGIIMAGNPTDKQLAAGNLDDSDDTLTVSDVVNLRDYIMKGIFE